MGLEAISFLEGGGEAMGIEAISFTFGVILLLIALLGGGFEVKELKVPKVGWGPRLGSSVLGIVFILLGVGMVPAEKTTIGDNLGNVPPPQAAPVDFTIQDQLGPNQISEQVRMVVNGKAVGDLIVDAYHPEATLTVTVPRSGTYGYSADATAVFSIQGTEERYYGTGQGMISVEKGKAFVLEGSASGNTWLVTLKEAE